MVKKAIKKEVKVLTENDKKDAKKKEQDFLNYRSQHPIVTD